MRLSRLAITAGLSCVMLATQATAQGLRQPASIQPTAYHYDYYAQEPATVSPSDAASVTDMPLVANGDCITDCVSVCCEPEPWRLIPCPLLGLNVHGWINAGATANSRNPDSSYNGPIGFNDRNEGQLNQLYGILERPVETDPWNPWALGGRIDLLFGSDAVFTEAVGFETRRDGSPRWNTGHYGLAMPQAYGEIGYMDARLKIGRFYTIIGYEGVMAPDQFFYSHPYAHMYGEPFTHTGGLLSYNVGERLEVHSGLVNGWDRFEGVSNRLAYLGGATYTPPHERYELAVAYITGQEFNMADEWTNLRMYSLVFSYDVTDNLQYIIQHDHGWQRDFDGPGQDAEWYGINQYLLYNINDCWGLGSRFEWFRDDDGARVAGVRDGNPIDGRYAGHFYQLTLGMNWKPTTNFRLRPEVRWDWYDGAESFVPGTAPLPFNDGNSRNQFTAAVDAILLW